MPDHIRGLEAGDSLPEHLLLPMKIGVPSLSRGSPPGIDIRFNIEVRRLEGVLL